MQFKTPEKPKSTGGGYYTNEELEHVYLQETNELKRLENILDSLYMAKVKDADWVDKDRIARGLYEDTKERIDFLNTIRPETKKR